MIHQCQTKKGTNKMSGADLSGAHCVLTCLCCFLYLHDIVHSEVSQGQAMFMMVNSQVMAVHALVRVYVCVHLCSHLN